VFHISTSTSTLVFSPITLSDKPWMDKALKAGHRSALEYSFTSNFIWRKVYKLSAALLFDRLIVMSDPENPSFIFPAGADPVDDVVRALHEYCRGRGKPLIFNTVVNEDRDRLEAAFPGKFRFTSERGVYDYYYEAERMISLSGKKLSSKRNHINRFMMNHPDWSYEKITRENIGDAKKMNLEWCLQAGCREDESLFEESCAVEQAFDHFFELGLTGGLLRAGGRVVAFSMGEPLNEDTYVIHVEKAFYELQGAYQMINQLFARENCQGYRYINREDDAGDEGLRKAKLSYDPAFLLEKSSAELIAPL